jgi:peptide/nickel transport system substrate-binding protein
MIRGWMPVAFVPIVLLVSGCPKPPSETVPADQPAAPSSNEEDSAATASATTDEESKPLLEPFDPPALADLEASVTWEERPIVDPFEMMRADKQQHPPLVSVQEALSLKNDSPEANEKILSALGQYPASDSDAAVDGRLERCTIIDLKSSNPVMQSSVIEFEYGTLTGIWLVEGDWNLQPHVTSETVVSWHTSSDRLIDKFVLRDDLTWTDGRPVTAHDFEFSFQTIMNPRVPIPSARTGRDQLKWVQAYDDRTVVVFHKEALATNVWNMQFPIIPRHIYEQSMADDYTLQRSEAHSRLELQPVTSGPYRLKSRQRGQEFVLERREEWYLKDGKQVRRKPYFREIRYRIIKDPNTALLAIKKGVVHDYEMNPEQWVTQTNDDDFYQNNTKTWGVEWAHAYIAWNCRTPLFEDKRVRQAMSYAFDHKEMLDEVCFGLYQAATGTFHPTAWMAPRPSPQPYLQDLDKAEELLDAAGWTDSDRDGARDKVVGGRQVDFEFTLMYGDSSKTAERLATLMSENLGRIGIRCSARPIEFTVLQERARKHEFQALMMGLGTGTDPSTSENMFASSAIDRGRNYGAYSNPEVDALFEQGKRELDREQRAAVYARIHMILWEDQPFTWLYYRNGFFGFNKRLRGYAFSPRGPYGFSPGLNAVWMTTD